ncbi:extracellular solute-binding protein [Paenibacillus athensensis]|nr:extracellular solute-binding protein [Paenibacillus athensensis]MCD1257250.1 extracellular solute-binding protein [Paenibacillus athensensis]
MSRKKRMWGAAAGALLLTVTVSGCKPAAGDTVAHRPPEAAGGIPYDPPITVTRVVNNTQERFAPGEDWDDNVFNRWSKATLGIQLKTLWVVDNTNDNYKTKLKLSLSSEGMLPDIVPYRDTLNDLNELIDSGRFMPVDELFDRYANETWKKLAAQYPEMWYSVTKDGKKWAVPVFDYTYNVEPVLWIREDWMRKLGLSAPQTVDDLERIMDAFVHDDPDGNGIDDTYGIAVTLRDKVNTWIADLSWLFGAYGSVPRQWNLSGGQLAYGSIDPGNKLALAKLRNWVEKRYIAADAVVWDETKAAELFTLGKAGIVAGPHWLADWPLSQLKANVPGAQYKAYPVPAGPDGKRGVRAGYLNNMVNGYELINKDSPHPEAYFVYYNYMLDHFANPQAGSEFENGFAEGYDWKRINGYASRDKSLNLLNPLAYSLNWDGARLPDLMIETLLKLKKGQAETPFEIQTQQYRTREEIEAAAIVADYERAHIRYPDYFVGASTPTMTSKLDLLHQMEVETYTNMIYGRTPIEAFDAFAARWRELGGDQITREVNDWYQSVLKK